MNIRKSFIAALAGLCMVLAAGCSSPAPAADGLDTVKEPQIKTETVGRISMGDPREQIAEVSASSRSEIILEAGGTVLSLLRHSGEQVRAGEVIAEFDAKNARIEKEKAAAALMSAESSLASTTADMAANRLQLKNSIGKLQELLKKQTMDGAEGEELEETKRSLQVSMKQLEALDSNAAIDALKAQVETSRLMLQQAEQAWNGGRIIAPTSGVLTDVRVDEGMAVQPGSLFGVVQSTDKVKLKANLTETAIQLVADKKELVFRESGENGVQRKAKIIYAAEVPEASTKLYALELEADNADRSLKPSARVQLQLTTPEEENVVAVPSLSVLREGTDTFVFVLDRAKAAKRAVRLGRINGPYQEVLSGVSAGDELIVSGQHGLQDGQTVER